MNATKIAQHHPSKTSPLRDVALARRGAGAAKERRHPRAKGCVQTFNVGGVDHTQFGLGCLHDCLGSVLTTMRDAPFNGIKPLTDAMLDYLDDVQIRPHDQPWATALSGMNGIPKHVQDRGHIGMQSVDRE